MADEIKWMILSPKSGTPVYQSDLGKPTPERGMEYEQAIRWADELLSETVLVPAFIYWDFPNPEACENCGDMPGGESCECAEADE